MPHPRSNINLNPLEDDPILQQVMLSRYISHDQLWRLARLRDRTVPRSTFNWRMDRLAGHGLLRKQKMPTAGHGIIYSILRPGMEYLISRGECIADVNWQSRRPEDAGMGALFHSLALNDMYLRLAETGAVFLWKWETEIRNHNELTGIPYKRDYDAIISLHLGGCEIRFALEYERNVKSSGRYQQIRALMEAEQNLDVFLYLAGHHNVLSFLLRHFANAKKQIYFGLQSEFTANALDMNVVDSRFLSGRLSEVLLRNGVVR